MQKCKLNFALTRRLKSFIDYGILDKLLFFFNEEVLAPLLSPRQYKRRVNNILCEPNATSRRKEKNH